MSTCPEKDIHSIYLDGELPEQFVKEYENHIASCKKCSQALEQLRKTHEIFVQDSKSLDLDSAFLDQSFERLQSRMKFRNVVRIAEPPKKRFTVSAFVPAAAAAAVVFAAMLPMSLRSKTQVEPEMVSVIQRQNITPISEKNVVVEGNLTQVSLGERDDRNFSSAARTSAIATATNASFNKQFGRSFTSVDVFRPEFREAGFKVPVPGVSEINYPNNTQAGIISSGIILESLK